MRSAIPDAFIVVVDNNSTDRTFELARKAIAPGTGMVIREPSPGKACAVRRGIHSVDAEIVVLCDADNTYPADAIPPMIDAVASGVCDMAVGNRHADGVYLEIESRRFHGTGNRIVAKLVNRLFRGNLEDALSGLRVMSRQFVRHYPITIHGFTLEVDMVAFALERKFRILEFPIIYRKRLEGSDSKLKTVPDGIRVLVTLFNLFRFYRPLKFFGRIALLCAIAGVLVFIPVMQDFLKTGLVNRFPLALLATGLELIAGLCLSVGLVLDGLRHSEAHRVERELLKSD